MIEIVRAAKAKGRAVTSRLNPVSLLLANDWANIERVGPYALSTWTGEGQTEALWEALNDGTIDVIGTDHAPHARAEKEIGWTDMWKASGGLPHLQETLPLFLTEVAAGRLSLERLVEITSAAPGAAVRPLAAQGRDRGRLRRGPRGRRPRGARARSARRTSSRSAAGPRGMAVEVQGLPVLTLVRGRVVYEDGRVTGEPGWGRRVLPGGVTA